MTIDCIATGSAANCYILTAGQDKLILDCGVRLKDIQITLGFDTANVKGCLVSHGHNDHSKALPDLMRSGIDCYMTRGTSEEKGASGHRAIIISAGSSFAPGNFVVYPFATEHDAAEPTGFLISHVPSGERLLYATDTFYLRYAFKGVHYMLIECNYCQDIARGRYQNGEIDKALYDRLMTSHMSLENLKSFLNACDLSATRNIVLLHMSDGNADEARMVREVRELTGIETAAAAGGIRLEMELCPF